MPASADNNRETNASLKPTGWVVAPWIDLLFLVNLTWPVLLLLDGWGGLDAHDGLRFWQIYFVTTPHRWITLTLVFADRRQFVQRPLAFISIACAAVALCLTVRATTGALTCLLAIDYVWNAWHFAAQHHGIFCIYGRLSQPERRSGLTVEKVAMRSFLCFVILRVAGGTWPSDSLDEWLGAADWVFLLIPCGLILRELKSWRPASVGRIAYLVSVMTLYVALLMSVHFQQPRYVLALATASAMFHATEYLAIVSWAVQRKHGGHPDPVGVFGYLAPRWGLALGIFITILGLGSWLASQHLIETWSLLNVIAAYLHYAYDGMIWRLRRPASYAN